MTKAGLMQGSDTIKVFNIRSAGRRALGPAGGLGYIYLHKNNKIAKMHGNRSGIGRSDKIPGFVRNTGELSRAAPCACVERERGGGSL